MHIISAAVKGKCGNFEKSEKSTSFTKYKHCARMIRETAYFLAAENMQPCRGRAKKWQAHQFSPLGAKVWLYDALVHSTFSGRH